MNVPSPRDCKFDRHLCPRREETPVKGRRRTRACRHERELLGVDSTAYFYRCERCGEVVVVQDGIAWRLRPSVA